jgi:hypothetical protein
VAYLLGTADDAPDFLRESWIFSSLRQLRLNGAMILVNGNSSASLRLLSKSARGFPLPS